MGKCSSKEKPAQTVKHKAPAKPPKDRKNLNPADFVISKRTGEVIVKAEGSIDGEQFNIEECKDCDIFLLDNLACAFVDECENCRIYIGPTESSVMLRNCRSCDFVIACQQYRTRDCTDCKCALLCMTEPIIETSSNMQFACFDFGYFSLRQQIDRAGLRPWNNKWWMVYDFNKNQDRPNWSLLPQEQVRGLLRPEAAAGGVSPDELEMDRVVPVTLGSRPRPSQESCFVVFLPDSEAYIEAFVTKADRSPDWTLARARATLLAEDRVKSLLLWTKEPKLIAQCKGREVTGVEVCGPGVWEQVQEALISTGLAAGSKVIRLIPKEETPTMAKVFFEAWKDEI
mmetsp:Transcript_4638/g.11350  ORF Transcript_4638/g.11350 Transcript_4638/m.11350 type:complete len:342 (-) Transcript_4638:99-1124(-)